MKTENSQSENLIDKVNKILKKIQNDPASFENIFTELFEKDFNEQLDNINKVKKGKLKGLIISVKDLFYVKGYKTKGGTKFIDDKIDKLINNDLILKSWHEYLQVLNLTRILPYTTNINELNFLKNQIIKIIES